MQEVGVCVWFLKCFWDPKHMECYRAENVYYSRLSTPLLTGRGFTTTTHSVSQQTAKITEFDHEG